MYQCPQGGTKEGLTVFSIQSFKNYLFCLLFCACCMSRGNKNVLKTSFRFNRFISQKIFFYILNAPLLSFFSSRNYFGEIPKDFPSPLGLTTCVCTKLCCPLINTVSTFYSDGLSAPRYQPHPQ